MSLVAPESQVPRAVVLTHAPCEGPGIILDLLSARGYAIRVLEVYDGAKVPEELPPEDLLVVMGGSMGVADAGGTEYPFLGDELRLLARRIRKDAPVLGICLGAQLLAAAAGARVSAMTRSDGSRVYEVGWAPVHFLHESPTDPALEGLPQSATVLHWHGDTFELPRGARRLASSALCDNQGFLLGSRLFGLQFHCEVTRADVERFAEDDRAYLVQANGPSAAEELASGTTEHGDMASRIGRRLIENILRVMTRHAAR